MEAIKNFLKPGGSDDNQQLYDSAADPNKGKVAGEGSHFGHSHTDSGVGGVSSPTTATNPTSGLVGSSATKTAEPVSTASATTAEPISTTSATTAEQAPIGTASTTTGDRAFPLSNTGTGSTANPSSQTGIASQDYATTDRTAAGTVPAAAGTTAAAASQPTTSSTTHASSTIPTQAAGTTTGTVHQGTAPQSQISSSDAQKIYSPTHPADDKCTDTLHGGSHVTQIARKIDPCYDEQSPAGVPSTLGSSSTASQPTAATTASTSRSEALAPGVAAGTGLGAATAGATGSSATRTADPVSSTSNTHNTAVPAAVGAGTGAGLAGASAAGHQHSTGQTHFDNHAGRPSASAATTVPTTASSGVAATPATTTSSVAHPYSEKPVDPRIDSGSSKSRTLDPAADQRAVPVTREQEHHYGRDAAVGGAAGAGAGALAGHEYSKKDAEHAVKEQKAAEKEHEKEVKHAEKEHDKGVKQVQKEHEKEVKQVEKEHDKEVKAVQKEHEKAIAKEEKQHEKEVKQHEKELEKERKKQEKEEKPGLIDRLLHRGDAKKDTHTKEEAAAAGAATGAGAAGVHEHNKLHKEPPSGYAQEPSKGYASQVTGGTGTTALAQGNQNIPPTGSSTSEPLHSTATVPGTRYGSGHVEHTAPTTMAGTSTSTQPEYYQNDPAQGIKRDPVTNPTKSNPLDQGTYGPQGYASTVTGGTGTTQLAHGTTTTIPTEGSVPGVTTETPYVDGPKAGTGKYAEHVTGGTGTSQLAQGQLDEVSNPKQKTIADKVEEALLLK